jgi:hypothetical protein
MLRLQRVEGKIFITRELAQLSAEETLESFKLQGWRFGGSKVKVN